MPTLSPLPAISTAKTIAVTFTHFLLYIGSALRVHDHIRFRNQLIRLSLCGFLICSDGSDICLYFRFRAAWANNKSAAVFCLVSKHIGFRQLNLVFSTVLRSVSTLVS